MSGTAPTNEEVLEWLVQNGSFAADMVAVGHPGTGAEKTRAIVKKALEALIGNGQIHIVPPTEWNYYFLPDPPYDNPLGKLGVDK